MTKELCVEIERGDLFYDSYAPVTDPKTGERYVGVNCSWTEGEETYFCPIRDAATIMDEEMADDYDDFATYKADKAKAVAEGKFDDDWVIGYFMDYVNENSTGDPWDHTEVGYILQRCHYVAKMKKAGAPLDIYEVYDEDSDAVTIVYGDKRISMPSGEFAARVMKHRLLSQEDLWKIANL